MPNKKIHMKGGDRYYNRNGYVTQTFSNYSICYNSSYHNRLTSFPEEVTCKICQKIIEIDIEERSKNENQ